MARYDAVLWDFDGTLADTSEGMFSALRSTLDQMGVAQPAPGGLNRFMGPPLVYSLQTFLGMPREMAQQGVSIFRKVYSMDGIYQCSLYPGVRELSEKLWRQGVRLGVATLKYERIAKTLLERLGLADWFTVCSGSTDQESHSADKADIINTALERMQVQDRSRAVLIGDTAYDAIGAQKTGIDFIAAAYGFGISAAQEAQSVFVAHSAAELEQFLLPLENTGGAVSPKALDKNKGMIV